jgi:pimeloyl-ACP methyl ester carboxylesterase
MAQQANITRIRSEGLGRAVVFLHGFTGKKDDTWASFPSLLGTSASGWDVYTVGYATTLLPDIAGVWSADPDLPILATLLRTQLGIAPFQEYQSIALIAHSMGGLIAQQALVDDPDLAKRIGHLILFGTPSGGLKKARWAAFWKRQIRNMWAGGEFITALRSRWNSLYGKERPFNLLAVAGASDQFVPPESSLGPFEAKAQRVVDGDHNAIVKPSSSDAMSVRLVLSSLADGAAIEPDRAMELRMAAEQPAENAAQLVAEYEEAKPELTAAEVVNAALSLEHAGQRDESIALLDRHKHRHPDIMGTLGGRYKRLWYETGDAGHADRALSLYQEGLDAARDSVDIFYLAINVAFLRLVHLDDGAGARRLAKLALEHAEPAGTDVWRTATVAEAHLYLNDIPRARAEYRRLAELGAEQWKLASALLQVSRIAAKLNLRDLAEELEGLFNPASRHVNRIFVSYSHKDRAWLDRLREMIKPYLHNTEVHWWEDTRLRSGDQWNSEIQGALGRAGVAVALVSAPFLASEYVTRHELPALVEAADAGQLRLLWACLTPAAWDATELKRFQAMHDVSIPLNRLSVPEQDELLLSFARQIKEAALSATQGLDG